MRTLNYMNKELERILDRHFTSKDWNLENFNISKDTFIQDAKEQLISNIYDEASLNIDKNK